MALQPDLFIGETQRVELAAIPTATAAERKLEYEPKDVSGDNVGYDIESSVPDGGPIGGSEARLRQIEIKGRIQGAGTVTVSRNEILTVLNKPEDWILALVEVPPVEGARADVRASLTREDVMPYISAAGCQVRYLRRPFRSEPDFDAVSVNDDWKKLWRQADSIIPEPI